MYPEREMSDYQREGSAYTASMIDSRSNTQQIADHYGRYVDELREFFKFSGVPFGEPEHLAGLTTRLDEDTVFRGELYSMTRSIIFREKRVLPPAELLRLLAVSVGGTAVDDQAEQHRPDIRALLQFLTSVTRAPVNQPRPQTPPTPVAAAREPDARAPEPRSPDPVAFGPTIHRSATPWSGKPSAQPWKWNELWSEIAVAGTKRLFAREHARWWMIGSAAALLLLAVWLWKPHAKARRPAASASVTVAAANSPQGIPEPSPAPPPLSPPEAQPAETNTALPPAMAVQLPHQSSPAARQSGHPAINAHLRREPAVSPLGVKASAKKPRLSAPPAPQPRLAPPRQPTTQARSSAPLSIVSEGSGPGPRHGEHPPGDASAPSTGRGTRDVSSGVMSANLISAPAPEYPKLANAIHLQGEVILQAVIDKNGQVTATSVLRGHHLLRQAAVNAVRQWRYRPFLANGRPVDVATVITVEFRRHH